MDKTNLKICSNMLEEKSCPVCESTMIKDDGNETETVFYCPDCLATLDSDGGLIK